VSFVRNPFHCVIFQSIPRFQKRLFMADIPNNASTSAALTIGGSLTSAIDSNGDRDWVRIDLGPGQYAAVNLTGIGLNNPILRVYDADGNLVAINDDVSEGFDIDSRVTIGSAEGGTFYIEAGAFDDSGTGSYQLTATETTPVDPLDSGLARGDDVITVYFVEDGNRANFDVSRLGSSEVVSDGWTQSERDAVMAALGVISNYVDLRFVLSTDPNADFQMVLDDNELGSPGLLGYFYLPGNANYTGASMGVFNANGFGWSDGLTAGGLGFSTVIHEALHGLGLDHPHDGDIVLAGLGDQRAGNFPFGIYGDFELNQTVYTIMSYNGGWNGASPTTNSYGDAASPMALDIAMLQELYGANTTYNNGNNTYELASVNAVGTGWVAIWDTGGVDTITYSGTRDTVIDLRPATLEYEVGGGGFISNASGIRGGFTIANGVEIENAIGGSGDDMLIGNGLDNMLDGSAGNDTVESNSGRNTFYGSSGNDQITGGTGADTIYGGSGNDEITGGGGNDALFGGRGNDEIDGGIGTDDITGGLGLDTMTGGVDEDTFIFNAISDSRANNADIIIDFDTGTDLIDLSMIDANLSLGGDQAFTFNAGGAPTSTVGEIWATVSSGDTIIFVDQNGDGIADMGITLEDTTGIDAGDFIL
jgi:Ca2+-binding RTX toxin-like protein